MYISIFAALLSRRLCASTPARSSAGTKYQAQKQNEGSFHIGPTMHRSRRLDRSVRSDGARAAGSGSGTSPRTDAREPRTGFACALGGPSNLFSCDAGGVEVTLARRAVCGAASAGTAPGGGTAAAGPGNGKAGRGTAVRSAVEWLCDRADRLCLPAAAIAEPAGPVDEFPGAGDLVAADEGKGPQGLPTARGAPSAALGMPKEEEREVESENGDDASNNTRDVSSFSALHFVRMCLLDVQCVECPDYHPGVYFFHSAVSERG